MIASSASFLKKIYPQPLVSVATTLVALVAVLTCWVMTPALLGTFTFGVILLAIGLTVSIILSFEFPIHVDRSTQVYINTVPLYLLPVLLPSSVAALTCLVSILAGELVVRKKRRTYLSDVLTSTGRLTLVVLLATLIAHGLPLMIPLVLRLSIVAVIVWAGDMFTAPLMIAPMTGERPLIVLSSIVRHSTIVEAVQYPLGVVGAVVAMQNPLYLFLLAVPIAAVHQHFKRLKELHDRTRQLLERIADTVDDHDAYTGGHSRRVALYTERIVKALAVDQKEADLIVLAARIHDIGKIDIPVTVLQKPGRLTPEERAVIEMHPDKGADMLLRYPGFARGVDMIRFHHEAWDGTGYPRGLRGTAIPFGARVIAVADTFDAMTSDRSYRKGMPAYRAALELQRGRGKQWDAVCIDAFLSALPDLGLEGVQAQPPLRLLVPQDEDTARAVGQ